MKKLHILISFSCLLFITACTEKTDFQYADGSHGSYHGFKDQWLVINYWAAWCKPCREEIPELNKLDENHSNVTVIGINFDKPEKKELNKQINDFSIDFKVSTADFDQYFNYSYPQALPTTIIISPQGEVKQILVGPQTEDGLLKFLH